MKRNYYMNGTTGMCQALIYSCCHTIAQSQLEIMNEHLETTTTFVQFQGQFAAKFHS